MPKRKVQSKLRRRSIRAASDIAPRSGQSGQTQLIESSLPMDAKDANVLIDELSPQPSARRPGR